ncbi:methyltransferase domain-containing protein [Paenibacillus sp. LPE1-1-1.1]|uniref:methyltransferase domain-containing protein n=1 Tax=Paenibacillus sp. LPE1-1-1.1 TaxID=3135230 RepID=UPI003422CF39
MSSYVFDTELQVWHREDAEAFNYSDGDESEDYLFTLIRDSNDKSSYSEELMKNIKDWPSRYHLTPTRHNLLRPLNINSSMSVLEIGCGCGAMTRYMAENAGKVVAVEGSKRRASIAAARCADLTNVSIYCDNFVLFEETEKFDVVTLIGVLEYAPSFVEGNDPVRLLLQRAKQFLKPNGVLLVAIENRLGLKYFNGAAEDHTGKLFDGLNDFYAATGVITYGKKELSSKLEQAGFSEIDFLYPYPDYKLPNIVVSEKAFKIPDFHIDQIIGQYRAQDYSGQENRLFHEGRAWNVIARNELAADMSNSFLVIARVDHSVNALYPDSWLASTYSTQRKKEFAAATHFTLKEDSSIVVSKQTLFEQDSSKLSRVTHHLVESSYIKGEVFNYSLPEVFKSIDIENAFYSYISPWINYLESQSRNGTVPGRFLDCTPTNLIRTDNNELVYIDDEWEMNEDLSIKYLIFRGLINTVTQLENHEMTLLLKKRSTSQFIIDMLYMAKLPVSQEEIIIFLEQEGTLNEDIYPSDKERYLEYAVKWINQPFPEAFAPDEIIDSRLPWDIKRNERSQQLKLYWSKQDFQFDEERTLLIPLNLDKTVYYDTKMFSVKEVELIRLEPQIYNGWGKFISLSIYSEKNVLLYSTDSSDLLWKVLKRNGIVTKLIDGKLMFIANSDSGHWILSLNELQIDADKIYLKIYMQAKQIDNELYHWTMLEQENNTELSKQNVSLLEQKELLHKELILLNEQLTSNQRLSLQLQQENELMINSRSWKITKGIRVIGSLLRKCKKKIKRKVKLVLQQYRILKQKRSNWDELLIDTKKTQYTLVISHTDYLISMGGTEKSILEQTKARTNIGEGTIVIFPAYHHFFGDSHSMNRFGIYIGQTLKGYFSLSDCLKFLEKISSKIKGIHIHHLLFWQYSDYYQIHELFVKHKKSITYFAHDFFISCSSYHMIQENEMGSQPCINKMKSESVHVVCSDCIHGRDVDKWRVLINSILKDTKDVIVPSIFVKETIEMIYPDLTDKIVIKPHLRLIETGNRSSYSEDRKLRVAYLGYKMDNKGWRMWEKLYTNTILNEQYDFYHIGSSETYSDFVKSFSYSFVDSGPMAAVKVLEQQEIDVVLLLSIVPESYSFTLQEALAAGAYIITTSRSGNIAHTIEKLGVESGAVINSDSAIMAFIMDKHQITEWVKKKRPKYKLVSTYEEGMI